MISSSVGSAHDGVLEFEQSWIVGSEVLSLLQMPECFSEQFD
jgi:hypothetical protein